MVRGWSCRLQWFKVRGWSCQLQWFKVRGWSCQLQWFKVQNQECNTTQAVGVTNRMDEMDLMDAFVRTVFVQFLFTGRKTLHLKPKT